MARSRVPAALLAGLIRLSQVDLGVHFAGDGLAGALLRSLVAVLVVRSAGATNRRAAA